MVERLANLFETFAYLEANGGHRLEIEFLTWLYWISLFFDVKFIELKNRFLFVKEHFDICKEKGLNFLVLIKNIEFIPFKKKHNKNSIHGTVCTKKVLISYIGASFHSVLIYTKYLRSLK